MSEPVQVLHAAAELDQIAQQAVDIVGANYLLFQWAIDIKLIAENLRALAGVEKS